MKIGIIQAASQKEKNQLLYDTVKNVASRYGHEVINFGVFGKNESGISQELPEGGSILPPDGIKGSPEGVSALSPDGIKGSPEGVSMISLDGIKGSPEGVSTLSLDSIKGSPEGASTLSPDGIKGSPEGISYIETALNVSFLLSGKVVDFIVTGCSSGQGMMLACNSLPGILCGYVPTPQDAFLFGRINHGNAESLPLGLNFGWAGEINLLCTIEKLFDGPFGIGYPAKDAERKRRDTMLLKQINQNSKRSWEELIKEIDPRTLKRALSNQHVYAYIMKHCTDEAFKKLLSSHR